MKHLLLFLLCGSGLLHADDIIICGQGGDGTYRARFLEWGSQLQAHLQKDLDRQNVTLFLAEDTAQTGLPKAGLATLKPFFDKLKTTHRADEDLYIYLIGHGSHMGGDSKLLLPGPDLAAGTLAQWLQDIPAHRVIVIAGMSSGAAFVNQLSGPDRIICSATKTVHEMYAAEYMGMFIQALREGSADRNRDSRISIHEACAQASALTATWYTAQGLIATEHAILDDNGDGLGTRLLEDPSHQGRPPENPDGATASQVYLKDFNFPAKAPKALIKNYLATLSKVEALVRNKTTMDSTAYYAKLEGYLIDAAKTHRQIRTYHEQDVE